MPFAADTMAGPLNATDTGPGPFGWIVMFQYWFWPWLARLVFKTSPFVAVTAVNFKYRKEKLAGCSEKDIRKVKASPLCDAGGLHEAVKGVNSGSGVGVGVGVAA